MDKITTIGRDGQPIVYDIIHDGEEDEEEILPPPKKEEKKKKNKKKKEKKEKKKEKKPKDKSNLLLVILPIVFIFVVAILWLGLYYQSVSPGYVPYRELKLAPFGTNTTSKVLTEYSKLPKMKALLKEYVYKVKPIVCLHHIASANFTGRVCLFKKQYLIVNPQLSKRSQETIETSESSIACPTKQEIPKKRHMHVSVVWEDELGYVFSSRFSGPDAVAFQMMMDEFEGKC